MGGPKLGLVIYLSFVDISVLMDLVVLWKCLQFSSNFDTGTRIYIHLI